MTEPARTKPGRGAWTAAGGLLPPLPGQTGKGYYYRPAYPGEAVVGSAGLKVGATYNDVVVTEAVRAIQRLILTVGAQQKLTFDTFNADGRFGDATGAAVAAVQGHFRLRQDAIVGPKTVWALIHPLIVEAATRHGIPEWTLTGIATVESQLDLGAVGAETPNDTGLVQVNRGAHPAVTLRQAVVPRWCLDWAGKAIRERRDAWAGETDVDPYVIAVAAHNSPAQASKWAQDGRAPSKQIAAYVAAVKKAGNA